MTWPFTGPTGEWSPSPQLTLTVLKMADDQPKGWSSVVVGTGVDPVTFRFSGGRSAN
jgi:hypothetical protein